jgi:hypothetical protein
MLLKSLFLIVTTMAVLSCLADAKRPNKFSLKADSSSTLQIPSFNASQLLGLLNGQQTTLPDLSQLLQSVQNVDPSQLLGTLSLFSENLPPNVNKIQLFADLLKSTNIIKSSNATQFESDLTALAKQYLTDQQTRQNFLSLLGTLNGNATISVFKLLGVLPVGFYNQFHQIVSKY